jgi:hypothetical protein
VEWLLKAGERAQAAYAWLTAAERYEAALALMPESGPEAGERGWLLYRISRMRRWESAARSSAYLDEALHVAERGGDRALTALVRFTRGIVRYTGTPEYADGLADLVAGVEGAEALTDRERERIRPFEPALAAHPRVGLLMVFGLVGQLHDLVALADEYTDAFDAAAINDEPETSVLIHRRSIIGGGYMLLGRPGEVEGDVLSGHRALPENAPLSAAVAEPLLGTAERSRLRGGQCRGMGAAGAGV